MKKILSFFVVFITLLSFSSCKTEDTPKQTTVTTDPVVTTPIVKGISVLPSEMTVGIGETKKFTVTDNETGMETSNVLWSSSDDSVASVDTKGNVTGLSDGKAVITVKTLDEKFVVNCSVEVVSSLVGVSIDKTELILENGQSHILVATLIPASAENKGFTWLSSNEAVATVTSDGVVTAISDGDATIMVTTVEGGFTAVCNVRVITELRGLYFDRTEIGINKGVSAQLSFRKEPANSSEQYFLWETSDPRVVIVTADGKITAMGAGEAIVKVSAPNGVSASCKIVVTSLVTGITLNTTDLTVNINTTFSFSDFVIAPEDATNKSVVFTSSNPEILSVSAKNNTLNAVGVGSAVLTVTTVDGDFSASCIVNVIVPVQSIHFADPSVIIFIGETKPLSVSCLPIEAVMPNLIWTSSNPDIATVSPEGMVTGLTRGSAQIYATTENGKITASCIVNVEDNAIPVTKLELPSTIELFVTETKKLILKVYPENATDKTYELSYSFDGIITVDENYVITAISAGTTIITIENAAGINAQCLVIVKEASQDLIINKVNEYYSALEDENQRHLAEINLINIKYTSSIEDKKSILAQILTDLGLSAFDETLYNSKLEAIDLEILNAQTAYESEIDEIIKAELLNQLNNLIAQKDTLVNKWSNAVYLNSVIIAQKTAYDAEIDAEEKLHSDNLDAIEEEYSFVIPLIPSLPTPTPTPPPTPTPTVVPTLTPSVTPIPTPVVTPTQTTGAVEIPVVTPTVTSPVTTGNMLPENTPSVTPVPSV